MITQEDIGGQLLDRERSARIPLAEFLPLGIRLADALSDLHRRGIIHGDIRPARIVFKPETGEATLIGSALATGETSRPGAQPSRPPPSPAGAMAYTSPEQTGRMNRVVDYRTDFYSLGATFYKLLTGKPPFEAQDELGMAHAHIAKTPVTPHAMDTAIPETVSDIIMKLMAKAPEDRYQSGAGLRWDLARCLRGLTDAGAVPRFELGLADLPGRLRPPPRLYGREREATLLREAFERVSAGACELMLVGGHAGVGKTALVHELAGVIQERTGNFLEGKFAQLHRNEPYSGWLRPFESFVSSVLMGSDADLARYKQRILGAVRSSGGVLTALIRSLDLIIGPQPPVAELGGTEAENRFNYVFTEFVKAIADQEHPLVVFLDDLQWSDAASLRLLHHVLTASDVSHLFVIGAYRDNEVDSAHPLSKAVGELESRHVVVDRLSLPPLSRDDIGALLAACLIADRSDADALAGSLHAMTAGNPFYTLQVVRALESEGTLTYDRNLRRWRWDANAIGGMSVPGDVADLIVQRLRRLPEPTQNILKVAACLGTWFDPATLSTASGEPHDAVLVDLAPAIEAQFITVSKRECRFVHDRVQQAAYLLIPLEERAAMHWRIGKLLLEGAEPAALNSRVFDIVDHLNIGAALFAATDERAEIATLNLEAGRKAKSRAAFSAAMDYFEAGLRLLGSESWGGHYRLTLNLHQEATEAAGNGGEYDRMGALATEVHVRASSLLDEIATYKAEIRGLTAQGKLLPAIALGLRVLERLGLPLPAEPTATDVEEHTKSALGLLQERTIEELSSLPVMSSPTHLACISILSELGEPAYASSPQFFLVWASVMAELSLRHGNCALSPFAYSAFALALCATAHVETGSRLAKAAIALLESLGARALRCRLLNIYGCTIQPWTEPLRSTLPTLQEASGAAVESGDFTSGSYAEFNSCTAAFFMGEPLEQLTPRLLRNMNAIAGMKQTYIQNWVAIHVLAAQRFSGAGERPAGLGSFEEEAWLATAKATNDQCGLAYYSLSNLIAAYLLGETRPGEMLAHLAEVKARQAGFQGAFAVPVSYFYGSLALLESGSNRVPEGLAEVRENLRKLEGFARLAPMNFQHKADLIAAELVRTEGERWEAARLYEAAIDGARRNAFVQEEALACELAARFYRERGMDNAAAFHLRGAYEAYVRWQAWTKVRALEAEHPELLATSAPALPAHTPDALDLNTVMKAARAISKEMALDRLLAQTMRIVVENAGAQSGALLLQNDGAWLMGARARVGVPDVEPQHFLDLDSSDEVPVSVIRFVARTRERVLLDDASQQGTFTGDPYIRRRKTRSLLCAPLLSRGALVGVAYVENNLTAAAFTQGRVRLLEMLLSQTAVSLENARLYGDLRESEARYSRIVNTAAEGIWVLDPEETTIFVNAKMCDMLGRPSGEILGRPVTDFMFEEDAADYPQMMERRRRGTSEHFERRFRHRDGHTVWTMVSAAPIFDDQGGFRGAFGMHTDITARKQAEQEMSLLNFAMNTVHEAAFLIDEDARFRYVNDEACRALAYDRKELLELGVPDIDPDFPADRWSLHWRALKERHAIVFEGHHKTKNGHIIPVEVSANYIEYGNVGYNLALVRDITERRRVETELHRYKEHLEDTVQQRTAELLAARDAAEAANTAKSIFLANMSHELRTPLNAILGFSSLMRHQPELTPEQQETLDIINRSGEHLLALINDVLEMAKVESGRMHLEVSPFDLGAMIRDVTDMMRLRAEEKGLQLLQEQSSAVPRYIKGDEARLRQILVNLVGNSVKFTVHGGVTIRLDVRRNGGQRLLIEVEDSGIGIQPEDKKRLFQPFVQVAGAGERKGTGLGLAITRQCVQLMGGTIGVESTPGEGSIFHVELPMELAAETDLVRPEAHVGDVWGLAHGQPQFRVLIAEDQRENQMLLLKLMTSIGLDARVTADGEQCVRVFEEWHPHFIWMDRRMPVMDGIEATRRIRQLPGGREVKIVAVTASAFKEQREELMKAGMDDFVRKPYRVHEIYDCLARQLGLKYVYRSTTDAVPQAPTALKSEMLAVLPVLLREELRAAVESLDGNRIAAAIAEVQRSDADLAGILTRLAADFDYPTMLKAL